MADQRPDPVTRARAEIEEALGKPVIPRHQQAMWDELDREQRRFILRGLGLDPETLTFRTMTFAQRARFQRAVERWAGCAARLQAISEEVTAARLAEHRREVAA